MGRHARTLVLSILACLAAAAPSLAQAPDPALIATKTAEVAERDARALCRTGTREAAAEQCQPEASQAAVDAFVGSHTHRTLLFQHALGNDVPMANAPWAATHNSFNSIEEMGPALS